MEKVVEDLFELIRGGVSPVHVTEIAKRRLEDAGFERLELENGWGLCAGGSYYLIHHGTTLIAFTLPEDLQYRDAFRMAAAHTDFPGLRIKPAPEITCKGYRQLNVEIYGGPILNTWLDRPLGIAGKAALKSQDIFEPKIVPFCSGRPVITIPNLAIHMNKEVNKGIELNRQTDMLPIMGLTGQEGETDFFLTYLAEQLDVSKTDILDFDLYAYNTDLPEFLGQKEELISAPRLDNLTSVQALLDGIIGGRRKGGINLIALFDHEEIGSRTKQGAGSLLLRDVIEKIQYVTGRDLCQSKEALYRSMLLSVDVAHAIHPNQTGKADITNQPVLNQGFCIKESGSQSYATDCGAIAIVQQICEREKIAFQKYVNRSDITGGGTLGAAAGSLLPIPAADIGIPLLAMHSSRELMGREDLGSLSRFVTDYFSI